MAVEASGAECFARISPTTNSFTPLLERAKTGISSNLGGSSSIDLPITVPEEALINGTTAEYLSRNDTIETSMSALMGGDFTYHANQISYLPFQVELFHELIHVLHNAQRDNLKHMPMSGEEQKIWQTYEEFVTIHACDICEADFAVSYGANPRQDHDGLATSVLFDSSQRESSKTLASVIAEHFDHAEAPVSSFKESFKQRYQDITNQKNNLHVELEEPMLQAPKMN